MAYDIVDFKISPNAKKRFRITLLMDGDKYGYWDFGDPNGSTYIDHQNKELRENYLKRHLANQTEAHRINNLIPSPALFSARLLWGSHTDLLENLVELQRDFNIRYK